MKSCFWQQFSSSPKSWHSSWFKSVDPEFLDIDSPTLHQYCLQSASLNLVRSPLIGTWLALTLWEVALADVVPEDLYNHLIGGRLSFSVRMEVVEEELGRIEGFQVMLEALDAPDGGGEVGVVVEGRRPSGCLEDLRGSGRVVVVAAVVVVVVLLVSPVHQPLASDSPVHQGLVPAKNTRKLVKVRNSANHQGLVLLGLHLVYQGLVPAGLRLEPTSDPEGHFFIRPPVSLPYNTKPWITHFLHREVILRITVWPISAENLRLPSKGSSVEEDGVGTQIPLVFYEIVDRLCKFFLHPFSIINVSSINNTPEDFVVTRGSWSFKLLKSFRKAQIDVVSEFLQWLELCRIVDDAVKSSDSNLFACEYPTGNLEKLDWVETFLHSDSSYFSQLAPIMCGKICSSERTGGAIAGDVQHQPFERLSVYSYDIHEDFVYLWLSYNFMAKPWGENEFESFSWLRLTWSAERCSVPARAMGTLVVIQTEGFRLTIEHVVDVSGSTKTITVVGHRDFFFELAILSRQFYVHLDINCLVFAGGLAMISAISWALSGGGTNFPTPVNQFMDSPLAWLETSCHLSQLQIGSFRVRFGQYGQYRSTQCIRLASVSKVRYRS
ncbi:hypothetical protein Tco_0162904 [Tanacetum coccineum]